jgi:hypothetical protein
MRMSKQIITVRRHLACFIAISLLICTLILVPGQRALSQQSAATTAAARNTALIAATQDVLKETSDLRQLSILRAVQSSTQSRAEIERAVIKNLDEDTSSAETHAAEVTMKRLGLAPPDFHYRALMIRVLTEQVAGYYEPKTRQFHLADWIDVDGQRPVMAHELTHALQDQHFDLRRFEHWPKGDSDAELAAHALIEGDATLAMVMYITSNPMRALTFLKSLGGMGVETRELDQAPRVLRESLLFPYQEGLNWTRALYKAGGWPEVSQAFTTLPQSTEQIIHPEKYLAHEAPVKVTLPDITSLLNVTSQRSDVRGQKSAHAHSGRVSSPQSRPSWKKLTSDVNGEWGTYLLLDQYLKSPADSRQAAAGWAGDRYDVYESSSGQVVYASISAWDTENDAREFYDGYVKRTQLRYEGAEPVTSAASTRISWKTKEGMVTIERDGSRVLVIEGYPEAISVQQLMRAFAR